MNAEQDKSITSLLDQTWLVVVLLPLLFKSAIEKFASAIFVFIGSDYNADDIVILDGRPGRIVRVGITKTTFYLYDIVDGKITGGTKLVVQNEKLADMHIEKPLDKLDIPQPPSKHSQKSS